MDSIQQLLEIADLPMSLLIFVWVVRETREMRQALLDVLEKCLDKLD